MNWMVIVTAGAAAVPLIGAALARWTPLNLSPRGSSATAALVSFAASVVLLAAVIKDPAGLELGWFHADLLSAIPMVLFSGLAAGVLIMGPHRELRRGLASRILLLLAATQCVYAADNLVLFALGWVVSGLSWTHSLPGPNEDRQQDYEFPNIALSVSSFFAVVAAGSMCFLGLQARVADPLSMADIGRAGVRCGPRTLGFLILAVLLRKGIFPFQNWLVGAFEQGPLLLTALLGNTHLGAYAVARLARPLMPVAESHALPVMSALALFASAYTALVALTEKSPRRLLALLLASQTSLILAGLESRRVEGHAEALAQWIVVSLATMGLMAVFSVLEARFAVPWGEGLYLGLATHMPRLATFFAIFGLALVGLPGILSLSVKGLLFPATLESQLLPGIFLVAVALNAISLFRLFSRLFLGLPDATLAGVPDGLLRERSILALMLVLLVISGLTPPTLMNRVSAATSSINPPQPKLALSEPARGR